MSSGATETQLVGEDWEPTTYEAAGAAELAARIEAAPPVIVPREVLDGRCGLDDRELWTLGVRTAPADAASVGQGIVHRLVIVAAVLGIGVLVAMTFAAIADLGEEGEPVGAPGTIALMVMLLLIAHGLLRLAFWAAERERQRRLRRRRVAVEPVAPLLDPHGRLTVAVLDGPGVVRVLLLWLRGHAQDADLLETRVVAERRVPRDEPGRAEDAVTALSAAAALAAHGAVAREGVDPTALLAATPKPRRRRGPRPGNASAWDLRVGPHWEPDGTTEEGETELARRLLRAAPERWSAELLAPLVVDDVTRAAAPPRPLPVFTAREPAKPRPAYVTAPALVLIAFLFYFVVSDPSEQGLGVDIAMRTIFLAATLWVTWRTFRPQIAELPHRRRRRPLLRRVDDAACDAAAPLEAGLPGGHGAVAVLTAQRGDDRLVRLVHLRRIVDAPEGTLEVRTLAERVLQPEDDVAETVGRFLRVADDQAFTTRRGRESVERLRRLSRRLGLTGAAAGAGRGRRPEPLVLLAAVIAALALLLGVLGVVWLALGDQDAGPSLAGCATLGVMAGALLAATRRWTRVGRA